MDASKKKGFFQFFGLVSAIFAIPEKAACECLKTMHKKTSEGCCVDFQAIAQMIHRKKHGACWVWSPEERIGLANGTRQTIAELITCFANCPPEEPLTAGFCAV